MKKRSTEILEKLIQTPHEELSIQKIMGNWHKTEKTLRNDIQEIFDFLHFYKKKSLLYFDGKTLKLTKQDKLDKLIAVFHEMNLYHYKMSLEERKYYIIFVLLTQSKYCSMQQLADEMFVTRHTIIEDCKVVNQYLQEHKIDFIAKSKKGIKIKGEDSNVSLLLIDIFSALLPTLANENSFFFKLLLKKIGFVYSLSAVASCIESYTQENSIIFAIESFQSLAIYIFVLVNRIQHLNCTKDNAHSNKKIPLDTIGFIVQHVLSKLGINDVPHTAIIEIEKTILAGQLTPQIQSINDFELYGVICHFLLEISSEIHIDLQSDDLLIKSLISHVKSMSNWGDDVIDMSEEYSSFEFSELRAIAENKYSILERYLQYALNEKMKSSIIIHICAALLRNRQNLNPYNVIISCPGSMATSKYLEAQIKNHFNFNVIDIMTTKKIEDAKGRFPNVDFIISTVNIQNCELPVVVVSPLIAFEDISKIQRLTFIKKTSKADTWKQHPVLCKVYAIYTSNDQKQISYLNKELSLVLNKLENIIKVQKKSVLLDMLSLKYLTVSKEKLDWRQAMKLASKELINDGFFNEKYLQSAMSTIEEYGAYIIIGRGVALAHGSKTSGVYQDGISLLIAKEGIFFDEGEKVHLLFFFSQKSDLDYLDLFKELMELGKKPHYIDKLLELEDKQEVYNQLTKIFENYLNNIQSDSPIF